MVNERLNVYSIVSFGKHEISRFVVPTVHMHDVAVVVVVLEILHERPHFGFVMQTNPGWLFINCMVILKARIVVAGQKTLDG